LNAKHLHLYLGCKNVLESRFLAFVGSLQLTVADASAAAYHRKSQAISKSYATPVAWLSAFPP
jgi:hypothetical protein